MGTFLRTLTLSLLLTTPSFANQAITILGPTTCIRYPQGAEARWVFSWLRPSLTYRYGYDINLCWMHNAPYALGYIFNRQGIGVCPIRGIKIANDWIFVRDCNAGDL